MGLSDYIVNNPLGYLFLCLPCYEPAEDAARRGKGTKAAQFADKAIEGMCIDHCDVMIKGLGTGEHLSYDYPPSITPRLGL